MSPTIPERRQLLTAGACAAWLALAPRAVRAAMGPNDKFDLLVRNANLLDPSQSLSGKRDIGIRHGVIESIETSIAPERALRVLDANNRLVTPGLIDLHAHTYAYGSAIGIPADELNARQGTTTVVSAGDAGANNIAGFRRLSMPGSRTRQFAFVHIAVAGLAGFPVPELFNIDFAQTDAAARTLAENADMAIGIKVRMSQNVIARHGLEPLKRAVRACEIAGTGGCARGLRLNTAAMPSSTSCLRSRYTIEALVSRAVMILLSLQPSPASETSAFSRMRAFSSRFAGLFPLCSSACSCSRSSALSRTTSPGRARNGGTAGRGR